MRTPIVYRQDITYKKLKLSALSPASIVTTLKASLIRTFLVGLILGGHLCAQPFDVEKPKPKAEPKNLYLVGGVNPEPWLQIIRTNTKDPMARPGYDPCYTYLLCSYKPIVKAEGDKWEIIFISPIAGKLP